MIYTIWIVSIIYCIAKMYKSYNKKGIDPVYATPGLETLAILVMAPVLMAVDATLTWVRKYKEYREEKQDRIF
jgi:hypothetical protein